MADEINIDTLTVEQLDELLGRLLERVHASSSLAVKFAKAMHRAEAEWERLR